MFYYIILTITETQTSHTSKLLSKLLIFYSHLSYSITKTYGKVADIPIQNITDFTGVCRLLNQTQNQVMPIFPSRLLISLQFPKLFIGENNIQSFHFVASKITYQNTSKQGRILWVSNTLTFFISPHIMFHEPFISFSEKSLQGTPERFIYYFLYVLSVPNKNSLTIHCGCVSNIPTFPLSS